MEPKKLEDLTLVETNAEIGLRMELIERSNFELNALRQHRNILAKKAQVDYEVKAPEATP